MIRRQCLHRFSSSPTSYRAEGTIKNVNTIEDFRTLDKTAILSDAGLKVGGHVCFVLLAAWQLRMKYRYWKPLIMGAFCQIHRSWCPLWSSALQISRNTNLPTSSVSQHCILSISGGFSLRSEMLTRMYVDS